MSRGKAFADRWMPVPIAGRPTEEQHARLRVALEQALAAAVPEIVQQLDRSGMLRLLDDEMQLTREMCDQIGQLVRQRALRVEQFPADEYSLLGNGEYTRVPLFDFGLCGLEFSVFYRERARPMWGTPSGFVVQIVA